MSRKIHIKYGKDQHDITLDADQTLETLEAKIYWITTVPAKHVKILNKGMKIHDDAAVQEIKEGTVLTIIGAKESDIMEKIDVVHQSPLIHAQLSKQLFAYGMVNLGNTCYLNSVVQLLKGVRELSQWLRQYPTPVENYGAKGFACDLGQVYRLLDKETVKPTTFVNNFITLTPTFGPLGDQQDAEEFLTEKVFDYLGKVCTIFDKKKHKQVNLIDYLFEIEYLDTSRNKDLVVEAVKEGYSSTLKLSCQLGDSPDSKITDIVSGIRAYLNDTVTKKSEVDQKDHVYERHSKITKLPPYLIVHEKRFHWKEIEDDHGKVKNVGTKVTKALDYPAVMDLFEFCTSELQGQLAKGRETVEKLKKKTTIEEETEFNEYLQKNPKERLQDKKTAYKNFKEQNLSNVTKRSDSDLYRDFETGFKTGEYNLVGIVSHLGNSIYSGHYMAWAHRSGRLWNKFDDDVVKTKKLEDALSLRGGLANAEVAYLLLYRRKEVVDEI